MILIKAKKTKNSTPNKMPTKKELQATNASLQRNLNAIRKLVREKNAEIKELKEKGKVDLQKKWLEKCVCRYGNKGDQCECIYCADCGIYRTDGWGEVCIYCN